MNSYIEDFVGVYEGAFSDDFCEKVISQFENLNSLGFTNTRQELNDGSKTTKNDTSIYTGMLNSCNADIQGISHLLGNEFNNTFWDQCYKHYSEHFSVLGDSGGHHVWGNKVQKTAKGEGYHVWHYEACDRKSSNRVLAYILYLNDVEEGGETEFLYLMKRYKPKRGTLLLFPAALTHTHRGNPPLSGDKYIITSWVEF